MEQKVRELTAAVVTQARITVAMLESSITIRDLETVAIGLNQTLRALDDYLKNGTETKTERA